MRNVLLVGYYVLFVVAVMPVLPFVMFCLISSVGGEWDAAAFAA